MKYHVTCNTDDNYAQHCCAMLCSLFENNKDLIFHIHLLIKKLNEENLKSINDLCKKYHNEITTYTVNESRLEGVKFRKKRPLTKAAYYRILLPEILDKNIDKILYLDCDIIVLGSVKELYEIELDNYALAACQDVSPYTELHRRQLGLDLQSKAFCSGLMMINIKYWRENNSIDKLIEYSKRDREIVYLHDQDALNYVFKNKWYVLPYKWGKTPYSIAIIDEMQKQFDIDEYVYNARILHYASPLKPWFDVWTPDKKYYTKYLSMSGFHNCVFTHVNKSTRIKAWISNVRYYLNRYIHPLIPNIIEIIILDIFNIIVLIFTIVFKPITFSKKILFLWLKKYK